MLNLAHKLEKSTKERVIFDTLQKLTIIGKDGTKHKFCVNDFLVASQIADAPKLTEVLMTLRCKQFLAFSDLKEFFTSVALDDQSMANTCFFMRPDGYCGKEPVIVYASTRLQFGFTDSGAAAITAAHKCLYEKSTHPKLRNTYVSASQSPLSMYIDDSMLVASSRMEVWDLVNEFNRTMKLGGFLCKDWFLVGQAETPVAEYL